MNVTGIMGISVQRVVVSGVCLWMLLSYSGAKQVSEQERNPETLDPRTITLYVRQSKTIRAPWAVVRVSVTDPKIADVQMLSPYEVLLQGKSVGSTDLIMWSKDERTWEARVDVDVDLRRLNEQLSKLFENSRLKLSQAQDVLIVSGLFSRTEHANQLHNFMNATNLKYVDMTGVAGVQQVQLQVRVAEVSRRALRVLGINAFATGSDFFGASTIGSSSGGPINPISIGVPAGAAAASNLPFQFNPGVGVSSSVTLFAGFPDIPLEIFIQALAENQYLRILAEPTLVALSGQEASFLAGGEFPVPIVQGSTAGGGTTITVEYREFGVRLNFRPTVLGDGGIRLYVAPEVSQLSDVGAVMIEGFQIPSLVMRKAETTLEVKSGQTFAMAGLLNRSSTATTSRVPGLGDLPILGALF
ncbi:MAG: type II and III secretion system protein family protein, partial [Planctomycetota bacterium]